MKNFKTFFVYILWVYFLWIILIHSLKQFDQGVLLGHNEPRFKKCEYQKVKTNKQSPNKSPIFLWIFYFSPTYYSEFLNSSNRIASCCLKQKSIFWKALWDCMYPKDLFGKRRNGRDLGTDRSASLSRAVPRGLAKPWEAAAHWPSSFTPSPSPLDAGVWGGDSAPFSSCNNSKMLLPARIRGWAAKTKPTAPQMSFILVRFWQRHFKSFCEATIS